MASQVKLGIFLCYLLLAYTRATESWNKCESGQALLSLPQAETPKCVPLCGSGQYLNLDSGQCEPCPENTFMHLESHTYILCFSCNTVRCPSEVVIQPCNKTHSGVLGCKSGYYRKSTLIYPFQGCVPCRVCSENSSGPVFEARSCDTNSDTVCCPRPGMKVIDTAEGPRCQHPRTTAAGLQNQDPKHCGKGEYLSIVDGEHETASCLPCPRGTYMIETSHSRTSCLSWDVQVDVMDAGQSRSSTLHQLTHITFAYSLAMGIYRSLS